MSKSRGQKSKNTAENQKPSFDKWLSVTNIVLTAIVGIGVAIYIQIRNENFQKRLQDEKDNGSFTNLTFNPLSMGALSSTYDLTGGGFSIQNDGETNAINIRTFICLKSLSQGWDDNIPDISSFGIDYSNPSLNLRIENSESSQCIRMSGSSNSILITLDTLPPKSQFSITLKPTFADIGDSQINTYYYSNISILYPIEMSAESCARSVQEFFRREYSLADFEVSVSCENCVETETKYEFLLADTLSMYSGECISPFKYSNYQSSIFDNFYLSRYIPSSVVYKYPQTVINRTDPLYLWISESGIDEISKDTYIQIVK